jgi:hypothetical protein
MLRLCRPALSGVRSGAQSARSGVKSDALGARSDVQRGAKVGGSDVKSGVAAPRRKNNSAAPPHRLVW